MGMSCMGVFPVGMSCMGVFPMGMSCMGVFPMCSTSCLGVLGCGIMWPCVHWIQCLCCSLDMHRSGLPSSFC